MTIHRSFRVVPASFAAQLEGTEAALLEDRVGFVRGGDAVVTGELVGLGRYEPATRTYTIPTKWTGGGAHPAASIDDALARGLAFALEKGLGPDLVLGVEGLSTWTLYAVCAAEGLSAAPPASTRTAKKAETKKAASTKKGPAKKRR
jgi:hypothetical protein